MRRAGLWPLQSSSVKDSRKRWCQINISLPYFLPAMLTCSLSSEHAKHSEHLCFLDPISSFQNHLLTWLVCHLLWEAMQQSVSRQLLLWLLWKNLYSHKDFLSDGFSGAVFHGLSCYLIESMDGCVVKSHKFNKQICLDGCEQSKNL